MGFSLKSLKNIGKKALNISTLGLSDSISDMFSKPKEPKIPEAEVIPTKDEASQRRARRRAISAQLARSGRASTIMSQDRETLG